MKVEKAACGASYKGGKVKAAAGGMMQMVKKTGYSTGGMAEKAYAKKALRALRYRRPPRMTSPWRLLRVVR
jgi:hypothetical protein